MRGGMRGGARDEPLGVNTLGSARPARLVGAVTICSRLRVWVQSVAGVGAA